MSDPSTAGTDLVLEVFRVNGLLLDAGDTLAAPEKLTSARWQVLGAIALARQPLPVPRIARRMGLARQSVQASVNRLVDDGMLAAEPNVDHARSPLFDLTDRGAAAYRRLSAAQQEWIDHLTSGLTAEDIQTAGRVLRDLSARLTSGNPRTDDQSRSATA